MLNSELCCGYQEIPSFLQRMWANVTLPRVARTRFRLRRDGAAVGRGFTLTAQDAVTLVDGFVRVRNISKRTSPGAQTPFLRLSVKTFALFF